ncbi:MAG TPA: hypothetical protein VGK06_12760 [Methanosarcina sp.]
MNKVKVFYLVVAASLLVILSTLPTSVALTDETENVLENKSNQTDLASMYNESELTDQEIGLNFRFLTSMLQMLDLNLNRIDGLLNSRVEEYPSLKPTIEGTDTGIATTNSIIAMLESDSENLSETEDDFASLNENMAQLNESLEYPDCMIEAANSTLGEPDITTPMIADMFKSVKAMIKLLE